MDSSVEVFVKKISSITENDYGDFMRTANLYLNDLRRELQTYEDEHINYKLVEMQRYIQFSPNWDVSSTREKILRDARYIDDFLNAHKQDWESAAM